MNPLLDKKFLYNLDQSQHKEIYAKIISLTFNENPLEQIEGRVTSGSISIDGNSTVRRSSNLTLIAKDINVNDFYWGVNNKFSLEIGIKNNINKNYPPIIWFKQGIYVITSFNSTLSNNNYTINISGRDKMCLLNGDVGGNLPSSVDFGTIDEYQKKYEVVNFEDHFEDYKAHTFYTLEKKTEADDNETNTYVLADGPYDNSKTYYSLTNIKNNKKLKITDIIREAVHTYGKEDYRNIIINDLDDYGLELMEYRGDVPLYLFYDEQASIYKQMTIDKNLEVEEIGTKKRYFLDQIPINRYNTGVNKLNDNRLKFYLVTKNEQNEEEVLTDKIYSLTVLNYGDVAGYRTTDLIYAGELIASAGDSLTSILDKIKNMLGSFEYYYDINGKFIFQLAKTYKNKSWNTLQTIDGDTFVRDMADESPYSYNFDNTNLISSFQNTPAINTLKNDYSVWGNRKSINGADIPIHARYAIAEKPYYYKAFDGQIYTTLSQQEYQDKFKLKSFYIKKKNEIGISEDWWEIIDWANYYKKASGEYPTGWIGQYCTSGGKWLLFGDETDDNMPDGYWWYPKVPIERKIEEGLIRVSGVKFPGHASGWAWYYYMQVYIFDVESDGTIGYTGHGTGCSHPYSYFLDRAVQGKGTSYIYKPKLPVDLEGQVDLADGSYHFDVDWREIIYQMGKDYFKHNQDDNFSTMLNNNNILPDGKSHLYPDGKTGYEIFYTDLQQFWRELYNPDPEIIHKTSGGKYEEVKVYAPDNKTYTFEKRWIPYKEEEEFNCDFYLRPEEGHNISPENENNYSLTKFYWNKKIDQSPETLNFWLDFFDNKDSLGGYTISNIGDRPKVINDSAITSIYFRNVPQVILIDSEKEIDPLNIKTGYTYIKLPNVIKNLFTISSRGKSAEESINNLFYQHSCCAENISITTIPIYYLEPNTLIHVHDDESNIYGEYNINRLTIPLTFNGMMSITANKIIKNN